MNIYTIPTIPFYFIRHGQTDWNIQNLIQGHIDIPLNQTGIAQAQSATQFLVGKGITRIVSSPLKRAYQTAQVISEVLQVPLLMHDGIKERFLGELEGTHKSEEALVSIDANYSQTAKNCEPLDAFKTRITNALQEVLVPHETTLIVAHGGVYWALTQMLGFENLASRNAVPYFFNSHYIDPVDNKEKQQWFVYPVQDMIQKQT